MLMLMLILGPVQSNSMVEAANKILKYQYLFPKDIQNVEQLCDGMAFYQRDFNNRPHASPPKLWRRWGDMLGLNQLELLSEGKLPDKNRFKNQLIVARRKRVEENQLFNCDICPNPTENGYSNLKRSLPAERHGK